MTPKAPKHPSRVVDRVRRIAQSIAGPIQPSFTNSPFRRNGSNLVRRHTSGGQNVSQNAGCFLQRRARLAQEIDLGKLLGPEDNRPALSLVRAGPNSRCCPASANRWRGGSSSRAAPWAALPISTNCAGCAELGPKPWSGSSPFYAPCPKPATSPGRSQFLTHPVSFWMGTSSTSPKRQPGSRQKFTFACPSGWWKHAPRK